MVECAEINIGDMTSEAQAGYEFSGGFLETNSWSYEGDADDVTITDDGRICTDVSRFSVSIGSTNMGLLIRRRADAVPGRQWLDVYIDDARVGDWYTPDGSFSNLNKRWVDTEFRVPVEYTAGKTSVVVRLERDLAGADQWSEYHYWVYGLQPLHPTGDADGDELPDTWEIFYFNNISDALPGVDSDGDEMVNFAEYIAGTDPRDSGSRFRVDSGSGAISFVTQPDRVYNVWFSTNLVSGEWALAQSNLVGSGQTVPCSVDDAATDWRVAQR